MIATLLIAGCVTPHLDGLATAECAARGDCADGLACIEGQCRTPDDPPTDSGSDLDPDLGLDMAPDVALDHGPDAAPDVALDMLPDGPPDALPDGPGDMQLDVLYDVLPDALPDALPDVLPDLAPDMQIDAGCIPLPEICNGVDDDCDDAIDEDGDPEAPLCPPQDGVLGQQCADAVCAIDTCVLGRFDVDQQLETGCECIAFGGFDQRELPEPVGIDADCDGVTGETAVAIFVSLDAAPDGDGSPAAPFGNLASALVRVRRLPQAAIVLAPGSYRLDSALVVEPGQTLVLVGGFVPDGPQWVRVDADAPLVDLDGGAHSPAADVAEQGWLALDGVRLLAAGTPAPVGMRGIDCRRIELVDSVLRVTGPVGAQARLEHDGADGRVGADAEDVAASGEDGAPDGSPGAGGANPVCIDAGGGLGGVSIPNLPADQGDAAVDGVALGGLGATAVDPAEAGGRGQRGDDGAAGTPGHPAGRWNLAQQSWLRAVAVPADVGGHGGGGGGGGSGLGPGGEPGAGGGGGAAGGCGGLGGGNGAGGFGAFGIVTAGACAVVLDDSVVVVPAGGDGGEGAAGGQGAPGAVGGAAGATVNALQPAGDGGDGGNGGCGGDGSGGPGGPSIGLLRVGDSPQPVVAGDSELRVADPSAGGSGSSNPACPRENPQERAFDGAAGLSLAVACCAREDGLCIDLRCDDAPR